MVKEFDRENVTDFDLALISLLGHSVTLKDRYGKVLIVGTLHTHISNPMKYFSVTNNNLDQHIMVYHEIFRVDEKLFTVGLNY